MGFLLYINIKLHGSPDLENQAETKQDVVKQLKYLESQLKQNGLGEEMQRWYPEGFVFVNALYGLTWAEVGMSENQESDLYNQALMEARYAYNQINSDFARNNFDTYIQPEYGIFYRGWKNYLLAKILALQTEKDSLETAAFISACNDIAHAITNSKSPFLESYYHSSWPADNFVAVASLKLHDEMFSAKYEKLINDWLLKVKSKLDPDTKLIPHAAYYDTGEKSEGSRGSSISLTLIFLADINPDFAAEQFKLFQDNFLTTRLALPAIREYPKGKDGSGDIDSGPVIFDIGFAGTIVSMGTFKKFGAYKAANNISNCIEGFGFPVCNKKGKSYLLGKAPIADAFIAWSRMQSANDEIIKKNGSSNAESGSIPMFHLFSAVLFIIIVTLLMRKKIIGIIKKGFSISRSGQNTREDGIY